MKLRKLLLAAGLVAAVPVGLAETAGADLSSGASSNARADR